MKHLCERTDGHSCPYGAADHPPPKVDEKLARMLERAAQYIDMIPLTETQTGPAAIAYSVAILVQDYALKNLDPETYKSIASKFTNTG